MENKKVYPAIIAAGAAVGFINGIFGGGGGMIAVPALLLIMKLKPHKAHATAIFVILPITVLSAVLYLCSAAPPMEIALPVTIGVFFGGILGAKVMPGLSGKTLTVIFCVIMLAAGIRMAFF